DLTRVRLEAGGTDLVVLLGQGQVVAALAAGPGRFAVVGEGDAEGVGDDPDPVDRELAPTVRPGGRCLLEAVPPVLPAELVGGRLVHLAVDEDDAVLLPGGLHGELVVLDVAEDGRGVPEERV